MSYTLLLGAEGCSEVQGQPWIAEATDEERKAFEERLAERGFKLANVTIDGNGRPYWVMTIHEGAPEPVKEWAKRIDRAVRIPEEVL